MIFLSRQDLGDEDTKEIIPISLNMKSVLQNKYYNVNKNEEKYMVQTRSQTKASGVQLPEVHGLRKRLDPHKLPEKQPQPIMGLDVERKPRIGQGKSWSKEGKLCPFWIPSQGTSTSKPIAISDEIIPTIPKSIIETLRS